jgi:hypothetical protein
MNVDADTVPMSLKVAAILLAASGAMAPVAGMVGPILGRAWCKQARAVRLRNWATGISSTRSLSLRCRLAMAPTVVGVVVWFSAIGAVGLLVVVRHVSARRRRPARGNKVIFAIISCVIVCIWGRWWFAQRKHFLWTKEGR